ncbi:MAG TPA: hypothetical protein VJS92_01260 [Candidatus Polarisedimenticolaceae bacterium]|nr:hypothetical protein [Candidatus Polarisedimenticolaceae bacterium]
MLELQIPTRRIAGSISTVQGATLEGSLFLRPNPYHTDVEDVLETLNDDRKFLPFLAERPFAGSCALNKTHIVRVHVPGAVASEPGDPAQPQHALVLADGSRVVGQILIDAPPSASRMLDKLNLAGRFVPVAAADGIHFVHLTHVVRAE